MAAILLHHSAVPAAVDTRLLERWIAALPPDKATRVAGIEDRSARVASLIGVALLHDCAEAAGLEKARPGSLQFPAGGKPSWAGGPDFSISHAAGHVACAMAPPGVRVGLDIEPAGAADGAALRLVASDAERDALAAERLTATDLWTAKEAVAKLVGSGIAGVAEVHVGSGAALYRGCTYVLARPALASGLNCTVAMSEAVPIAVREVSLSRLLR